MTKKIKYDIPQSPLARLWHFVSLLSGILGLASIVKDFVEWRGWILQLVESYRGIIHPVFEFIFSWVDFDFPPLVFDYFVIGILVASSYVKALKDSDYAYEWDDLLPMAFYGESLIYVILLIFSRILFWPIIMVYYLYRLTKGFDEEALRKESLRLRSYDKKLAESRVRFKFSEYLESIRFFHWLGFVILGLVSLSIVNWFS